MKDKVKKVENTSALHSSLTFFNKGLSSLNNYRQQMNRSRSLAKYLSLSHTPLRSLEPLDTPMGVMSFLIYLLRFSSNVCLLIQYILVEQQDEKYDKKYEELYFILFNDFLWSCVNLCQFFWLSFRNSQSAGFRGMQLEVLAQIVDFMIMIVRHEQDKEEYLLKYRQCSGAARAQLVIEWQNKELHFISSAITAAAVLIVIGLFAFSITSVPLAPVLSIIMLISNISRLVMDMEKDKRLVNQLKIQQCTPIDIAKKKQGLGVERLKDINQVIIFNIFLPVGLFCFITLPTLPLSFIAASLICCFALYLTQMKLFNQDEVWGEAKQQNQLILTRKQ